MSRLKYMKNMASKTDIIRWNIQTLLCGLLLVIVWIPGSHHQDVSFTSSVDMSGSDCDRGVITITDTDVLQVSANPPQLPSGEGTRDSCTVEFRVDASRRIRIFILGIVIYDCGTFVQLFDAQSHLVKPRWTLGCKSGTGMQWTTAYSRLVIKLVKQTPQAINYRFNIALTTTEGPVLDFEQAAANWRQEVLTDGAIAGIGVAAAVIILAFVLIIIFIVVRVKKKQRMEDTQRASNKAASTTYSQQTFASYASRHYSHDNSQDYSSVDSKDAPSTYKNSAYKPDSPKKSVKSILKSDKEFKNEAYDSEATMDTTKLAKDKKSHNGFIYRQSRSGSTRSLDKPHIEYTDISDVEYQSDRDREKIVESKRRRSHRDKNRQSGDYDNKRNESKDRAHERPRTRSETRSEKSRHQSEYDRDYDYKRERDHRDRDYENGRYRERERDDNGRHRDREYDREYDQRRRSERERPRERERSRGRSRTDSEHRDYRERDRSYSPHRRSSSNSRPRANSTRSQSQSNGRYSTFGRYKTPSTGGRSASSDYVDTSRRKGSERSSRQRSHSASGRNGRSRSSDRHSRRDY
ncbi:uncharacterized protein DDB_G0283697 isoform X1 [Patella vulgata]|uniref:uncharacterized protein DDB_G0283697 isoform X1 n=1 Tax=Patella vulgata TaxID=6465 RepID=UPI0024A8CB67|nr:uncharacterized protein DDB_G0283697 isoform X1 [Patella vulgata]